MFGIAMFLDRSF